MRTRDFSFGEAVLGYDEPLPPPELRDVLSRYTGQFKGDAWANSDASSKGVTAWGVRPEDAAENIDESVKRVEAVLRDLAEL